MLEYALLFRIPTKQYGKTLRFYTNIHDDVFSFFHVLVFILNYYFFIIKMMFKC